MENASSSSQVTETSITSTNKESKLKVLWKKEKWIALRKCLFRKSCAVYILVTGFVWLLYTIPIIAYFSTNKTVGVIKDYNILLCKVFCDLYCSSIPVTV